jgi:cytosolic 5'-nucleotidase 3
MENILISNPENLQEKIDKFKQGGVDQIHILADFDKTLTRAYHGDKAFPSVISLLRDGNHLTSDYAEKAHALYNHYRPIEIDFSLSIEEREKGMEEWWAKHIALLIESGLKKTDLEDIVGSGKIKFRDGARDFLNGLKEKNIPLVVISSNGVGNTIPMIFEKENMMSGNIHIITNVFEWDDDGKAVRVNEPHIHALNKREVAVKDYPVYHEVENRKNVLILGDSIDDIGMVEGFDYNEIIKIGFLNEKVEENKEKYLESFDVVITGDGDMGYVNELMGKILDIG